MYFRSCKSWFKKKKNNTTTKLGKCQKILLLPEFPMEKRFFYSYCDLIWPRVAQGLSCYTAKWLISCFLQPSRVLVQIISLMFRVAKSNLCKYKQVRWDFFFSAGISANEIINFYLAKILTGEKITSHPLSLWIWIGCNCWVLYLCDHT